MRIYTLLCGRRRQLLHFAHARKRACAWLIVARYSYDIYLSHLYAQWVALVVLKNQNAWVRYGVLLVLSAGLPMISYHLVEAPMIRLGARVAKWWALTGEAAPLPSLDAATRDAA